MGQLVDVFIVSTDDWEALYINGEERYQHHQVDSEILKINLLGNTVRSWDEKWFDDVDFLLVHHDTYYPFPPTLKELKELQEKYQEKEEDGTD